MSEFLHMKFTNKRSTTKVDLILELLDKRGMTIHQLMKKLKICRRSMDAYIAYLMGRDAQKKQIYIQKWIEREGGKVYQAQVYRKGDLPDAPKPPPLPLPVIAKRYRANRAIEDMKVINKAGCDDASGARLVRGSAGGTVVWRTAA